MKRTELSDLEQLEKLIQTLVSPEASRVEAPVEEILQTYGIDPAVENERFRASEHEQVMLGLKLIHDRLAVLMGFLFGVTLLIVGVFFLGFSYARGSWGDRAIAVSQTLIGAIIILSASSRFMRVLRSHRLLDLARKQDATDEDME